MRSIKEELKARKEKLLMWQKEKEKALISAPEGTLRINVVNGNPHYYHRTNPKDFSGRYIRKEEEMLIKNLAQKEYDKKVLRSVEDELKAISYYLSKTNYENAEQIYKSMHKEKQRLITPVEVPIEEYIQEWQSKEYEGIGFEEGAAEIYTAKGERVRSKSEMIIADMLEREGIPYRYECPLRLKGWGIVYPDFTILHTGKRKEIYWEHLGMMDQPEYAESAIQKIASYEKNELYPGEELIFTFETRKTPLNRKMVQRLIERYFK